MELRLPLEVFPGRQATCRAVFGTWGSFPDDARASHCPFVLTSRPKFEQGKKSLLTEDKVKGLFAAEVLELYHNIRNMFLFPFVSGLAF